MAEAMFQNCEEVSVAPIYRYEPRAVPAVL